MLKQQVCWLPLLLNALCCYRSSAVLCMCGVCASSAATCCTCAMPCIIFLPGTLDEYQERQLLQLH